MSGPRALLIPLLCLALPLLACQTPTKKTENPSLPADFGDAHLVFYGYTHEDCRQASQYCPCHRRANGHFSSAYPYAGLQDNGTLLASSLEDGTLTLWGMRGQ